MSFSLDPALDEYAAGDCLTCYAAGKTPKYLYVCFTGIEIGDNWIPGVDPPPPNGVHRVEWSMACDWGALEGNIGFAYRGDGDWSRLQVYDPWIEIFDSGIQPACILYFENSIVNPVGNKYYDGFAIVISTLPGNIYSESDLVKLLNIERTENLFANVYPMDHDQSAHTIFTDDYNDRISIKVAHEPVICAWSGAIVDIPEDWHLCDGTAPTPDLRDKFIESTERVLKIGTDGGSPEHKHKFTGDGHDHSLPAGTDIASGTDYSATTAQAAAKGSTGKTPSRPPYYALCYIMHVFIEPPE